MMTKYFSAALIAAAATTAAAGEPASRTPKDLAIGAFDALFQDYSEAGLRDVFAPDIIQHNVLVPTGRDALIGLLPVLKEFGTTYENLRLLQDGPYAIMHNVVTNAHPFGAQEVMSFNVYRVENGQIAEHWGAPTPVVEPAEGMPSQFGGATDITDLDKTDANKAAFSHLFEVIVNGTPEQITETVTSMFAEDYINHSPGVGNGVANLFAAFQREQWVYTKTHKVLGEGNFVLAISEGTAKGAPTAFYDLVRFENGRVVEHWDVILPIPGPGETANDNGMFGFD